MNEKLLMETVALAGKIMLASGAEVYGSNGTGYRSVRYVR